MKYIINLFQATSLNNASNSFVI